MDYYMGLIALFPYSYAPMNWLLCDGQILSISENEVLFTLIRTDYGGNGSTNFALPNMLGLEPIPGMNYYICNDGLFPVRD